MKNVFMIRTIIVLMLKDVPFIIPDVPSYTSRTRNFHKNRSNLFKEMQPQTPAQATLIH